METESPVIVAKRQVDELGHLNHVSAVEILERARDDWYRDAGLWDGRPYSGDETLGTLVLNLNVNYRAECFVDESLRVLTRPLERGRKSFVLAQTVLKADGTVAIDARVTSIVMDLDARATLAVPASLARYLPPRS